MKLRRARFVAATRVVSSLDRQSLEYLLRTAVPPWVEVRGTPRPAQHGG